MLYILAELAILAAIATCLGMLARVNQRPEPRHAKW